MKKTILVTGGAGYIGSHTVYLLRKYGYHVVVIDLFVHNQPWPFSDVTLLRGDFADETLLHKIFSTYAVQAVMHFAAFIEVGESVRFPEKFYENNVLKTKKLLEIMIAYGIYQLVFSSSCAVYGDPLYLPLDEQHPTNPLSPYGQNKLDVEVMLQDFASRGLRSVALRYFNAAGASSELGLGEYHKPESHLVPLLLRALRNDLPFTIFGKDYATADGTCIRDFIHVKDIAQAHVDALHWLQKLTSTTYTPINIGSGIGYSVLQVINTVQQVTSTKVSLYFSDRRAGDCPLLVAQADRAYELLGWQPQHSGLDEIISSAWLWER